jgi:hypothetical protein
MNQDADAYIVEAAMEAKPWISYADTDHSPTRSLMPQEQMERQCRLESSDVGYAERLSEYSTQEFPIH